MNGHLLRALDNYLALPLILIEDESTRGRTSRDMAILATSARSRMGDSSTGHCRVG